jgi:ribonuclease-3
VTAPPDARAAPLDLLGAAIGHRFAHPGLLDIALTHRSCGGSHNERLEFLGDSVLNCLISSELYHRFPRLPEGDLSRIRASLVRQQTLHELARGLRLGDCIRLGEGELKSGGATRPSILADTLEAVLGAVYLDAGMDAAARVVSHIFGNVLAAVDPKSPGKDPKTLLQELLQGRRLPLPVYSVVATTGEAHEQHFLVECVIERYGIRASGEGTSRRAAEQAAAQRAFEAVQRSVEG